MRKVLSKKFRASVCEKPKSLLLSINQLAASPSYIERTFCPLITLMKNRVRAGESMLSAVPEIVWLAFIFTAAKERSREKSNEQVAENCP